MLLYKKTHRVRKANVGSKLDAITNLNQATLFFADDAPNSLSSGQNGVVLDAQNYIQGGSTGGKEDGKTREKATAIVAPASVGISELQTNNNIDGSMAKKIQDASGAFKNITTAGAGNKKSTVATSEETTIDPTNTRQDKKFDVAGAAPAINMVGNTAIKALSFVNDGDDTTYSDGEFAADVTTSAIGGAMSGLAAGAALGSVVPVVGTAIGAAVGLAAGVVSGLIKKKKMEKEAVKADIAEEKKRKLGARRDIAKLGADVKRNASDLFSAELGRKGMGYGKRYAYRDGGIMERERTFHFSIEKVDVGDLGVAKEAVILNEPVLKLKAGGKVKSHENIIPNGVLHEEENQLGDKGMPVVKCDSEKKDCVKHYEIEMDELILTLETTETIEKLAEKDKLKELGKFVKEQLLDNTHSFTKKFNELNG